MTTSFFSPSSVSSPLSFLASLVFSPFEFSDAPLWILIFLCDFWIFSSSDAFVLLSLRSFFLFSFSAILEILIYCLVAFFFFDLFRNFCFWNDFFSFFYVDFYFGFCFCLYFSHTSVSKHFFSLVFYYHLPQLIVFQKDDFRRRVEWSIFWHELVEF